MTDVDADTIQRMWTITLIIYGVVVVVVAVLLTLTVRAGREVLARVSAIWTVGQQVANNTIHVALLDTTVHIGGGILGCATGIAGATDALRAHAEGCSGCPACVLGQETTR